MNKVKYGDLQCLIRCTAMPGDRRRAFSGVSSRVSTMNRAKIRRRIKHRKDKPTAAIQSRSQRLLLNPFKSAANASGYLRRLNLEYRPGLRSFRGRENRRAVPVWLIQVQGPCRVDGSLANLNEIGVNACAPHARIYLTFRLFKRWICIMNIERDV